MKKMILGILLSAIMLLCGCGADAAGIVTNTEPQVSGTPDVSVIETPEATPEPSAAAAPEATPVVWATTPPEPAEDKKTALLNSVLARVQENIDTGTFEGFTQESTFQDVAASGMELSYASYAFAVDFLTFPANILYSYAPAQNSLMFSVIPDERADYEEKITDILNKLDDKLGSHTKKKLNGGGLRYTWQADTSLVYVQTNEADYKYVGQLATIRVENPGKSISPCDIPGIFCSLFGVEYTPAYENEMLTVLINKGDVSPGITLTYLADDISVRFYFKRDKASNSVMFYIGDYTFTANTRTAGSSLDYMEACVSSFQKVLGDPQKSDYYLKDADSAKTAEEMKQVKCDFFRLDASWVGIDLTPNYYKGNGALFWLTFNEGFFLNADWYKD